MKNIRISNHAYDQIKRRGTDEFEVVHAIQNGKWENAELSRLQSNFKFDYNAVWNGKTYKYKQVKPIFVDEDEIVVVTVYTYYFNE